MALSSIMGASDQGKRSRVQASPDDMEEGEKGKKEADSKRLETPSSIHHAAIACWYSTTVSPQVKMAVFVSSSLLVVVQFTALASILGGASRPTCGSSADCPIEGQYCLVESYCARCTKAVKGFATICCSGATFNLSKTPFCAPTIARVNAFDPTVSALNGPEFCTACSSGNLLQESIEKRMLLMRVEDIPALAISLLVVATAVLAEARDIHVSMMLRRQLTGGKHQGLFSIYALFCVLDCLRLGICLPLLFLTFPELIAYRGFDALNVCMNTVAVIFILEVDNLLYAQLLSEAVRSHFEENHQVLLTDNDAFWSDLHKVLSMVLTCGSVLFEIFAYRGKVGIEMGSIAAGRYSGRYDRFVIMALCSIWAAVGVGLPEMRIKKYTPSSIALVLVLAANAVFWTMWGLLFRFDSLD